MFLSLRGTMIPTQAGDYDRKTPLSYGGWIATREGEVARTTEMQADDPEESPASNFAKRVQTRAHQNTGGGMYVKV